MSAWLQHNRKQLAIAVLFTLSSLAIYLHPELRGPVLLVLAGFGAMGLQVRPIAVPTPQDSTPPAAPEPPPLPVLFFGALLLVVLAACGAGASTAAYGRDLAACELLPSCEAIVACRAQAAHAAGRTFKGDCLGDGGAP